MNTKSINVLVAGGCHTNGYPVGRAHGFIEVAVQICAEARVEVHCVSPVHLGHANKVTVACDGLRFNTLILQMGHFETTKRMRAPSKIQSDITVESLQSSSQAPSQAIFQSRYQTLKWDVKNQLKQILASFLDKSDFDASGIHRKLSVFCDEIVGLGLPQIVLLSPLPCADRVSLRKRKKIVEYFRIEAARSGFVYIDAMSSLLAAARGKDIYYDAIHLNHKGHALLGELVAQVLMDTKTSTQQQTK